MRAWLPIVAAALTLAVLQLVLGRFDFFLYVASLVGVNVILAVSLNIINGMTGQFSIGHAGFMAVGGYAAAFVTCYLFYALYGDEAPRVVNDGVGFGIGSVVLVGGLVAGALAAALAGLVVGIPSLRLKGDYLAIVTLGFGEIVRLVAVNTDVLGRRAGIAQIPKPP